MVFFHAFSLLRLSVSRLAWLEIRLVLSAFCHPSAELFALKSVFLFGLGASQLSNKGDMLVGWLVGSITFF